MYVDAIYDKDKNLIRVVERVNGERVFKDLPAEHVFYYAHAAGSHKSIFGDPCKKSSFRDPQKFRAELRKVAAKGTKIFESDINPVFRALSEHYMGAPTPDLNVAFWDIETDFEVFAAPASQIVFVRDPETGECEQINVHELSLRQSTALEVEEPDGSWTAIRGCSYLMPGRGFAPVEDPFNPITGISLYCKWLEEMITLVLAPPSMTLAEARALVSDIPNTLVYDDEAQLLRDFLELMEPADLHGGWNSTLYDVPYTVRRIRRVLGDDALRAFCLWDELPREREIMKFGKKHLSYDLVGRCHLDYLELYQKHNTQQLHSYRLDYVGEIETGEHKVPYEGTLDDLYKKDFRKFVEYSRQDVNLLVKIDAKRKYFELSNQIAHANCVLLKTTMGSVALVEQAIINDMHAMGMVAPERQRTKEKRDGTYVEPEEGEEAAPVVGAYVADPKVGLSDMIGVADLNSLYPSTIRALNMSPETTLGQFRLTETEALIERRILGLIQGPDSDDDDDLFSYASGDKPKARRAGVDRAEAWDGLFSTLEYQHVMARDDASLIVDFDDGRSVTKTGAQWYDYIFDPKNHVCVTANGTLFSTKKDGIIPMLLANWYADRKKQQKLAAQFEQMVKGIDIDPELSSELEKLMNRLSYGGGK